MESLIESITNISEIVGVYKKSRRYTIPFSAFDYEDDIRILGLYKIKLELYFNKQGIKVLIDTNYLFKHFVVYEVSNMERELVLNIPYGERSKYVEAIYKINKLIGEEGCCWLCVNNVPYCLDFILYIRFEKNKDKLIKTALKYKLEIIHDIGDEEILIEMGKRQYNISALSYGTSVARIRELFTALFIFPEKSYLEQKGYCFEPVKKPKLFVSYTHKDKKVVYDIIDSLEYYGLNLWIDKKQIDVGDSIMEAISKGMAESDLGIVLLSENTKEARFAKHELSTFFANVIQGNKKWFIIRLDDVNPDDIYLGLGNYKYFDYSKENLEKLVVELRKKLEHIKSKC